MSLTELLRTNNGPQQPRNKIYGVVTGIVRDIKDPENLGRVKVDFPWLAEDADAVSVSAAEDRAHSYWARIATLMAGNGRGTYFIPEIGDEVLVAFEHGDLDRPFVLGALWNADDAPPETMDSEGHNHVRSMHSRSGHMIVLNDSDDAPAITIVDNTGANSINIDSANNTLTIKVNGDLTIEAEGNISITGKGKVEIGGGQDIALQTKANLTAEATGNCDIESSGPLTVKSSAKVTVDGTGQAEVKAATVSVNGSGMAELKGALVKIN